MRNLIFHVKVSLAKRLQTELFLPLKLIKKLVRPQKALTFEEYSLSVDAIWKVCMEMVYTAVNHEQGMNSGHGKEVGQRHGPTP